MTEYTCKFCDRTCDEDKVHWVSGHLYGLEDGYHMYAVCPMCYYAFATGYNTAIQYMSDKLREVQQIDPVPTYEW